MSFAASVLANRYVSVSGVAALLYDHALTFEDEVRLVWLNPASTIAYRLGYIVNRYVTEALAIYVVYVLSGGAYSEDEAPNLALSDIHLDSVFICIGMHVELTLLYSLWDHRQAIKWILGGGTAIAISICLAFMVVTANDAQVISGALCAIAKKPWALPYAFGALTILDLFVIAMSVLNALDRPYQRQADIMKNLQRDGAVMFLFLFFLRVLNLVLSIVGNATYCFVTATLVWSMCCIVTSRIQLRVEALRFIRFTGFSDPELRGIN
ncbi:hypothetical protein DFH07DRAFT_1023079 [Mycena maculata]|uniref:DUF6533 domain-containing protein n=1 Tax=Mycena maculata TaxID=230809 RepID=A0AAD7J9Y8_9AGAR|nr:hypothetical protein DFH07DRAFT_1023079 [Mycena maculata]